MRFQIKPRHRLGLLRYTAEVGEHALDLRQARWLHLRDHDEWHCDWPGIGEVRLVIPMFRRLGKPEWHVKLAGETICTGEFKQAFMPSKHDGIFWHFGDEILFDGDLPRFRMHHALWNQTRKVYGCWNTMCYGARGVIRSSLPLDTIIGVFGVAVISVLTAGG